MKKTMQFMAAMTSLTLFSSAVMMPASAEGTKYDPTDHEACYSISFIDEATNKHVENVQAKLCRIETDRLTGQITSSGELSIIDEWNSSDESVYNTEWYPAEDDYAYIVIVDELPDGYTYDQQSGLLTRLDSGYQTGKVDLDILLERGEPDIPRDYPLNGTFSLDIAIKDMYSGDIIKGVECELINEQTGEVISAWNTSEQEKMHLETLEYKFNTRINQETGSKTYAVRIKDMPEGYKVSPCYVNGENGITIQHIGYSMFYIYYNNNELSYTVPLVNSEETSIVTTTAVTQESQISTDTNEIEPQTFHCYECGRDVPLSEVVNGPLRSICRDCYEEGGYIGTRPVITPTVFGDANLDKRTSVADSVAILQYIGNKDDYPLTSQGLKNADVDGVAGVTASDALTIQKVDAGLLDANQLKTTAS